MNQPSSRIHGDPQAAKLDEARTMFTDIYDWFTEGFGTAYLKDARTLLDEFSNWHGLPQMRFRRNPRERGTPASLPCNGKLRRALKVV